MAVTHVWKTSVKPSALPSLPTDTDITITGNESIEFEALVSASATKELEVGEIDLTKVVSFVLHSSKADVTCNTNAVDATGGQGFDLVAGKAQGWHNQMVMFPTPITDNITALWVINEDETETIFRASFLMQV